MRLAWQSCCSALGTGWMIMTVKRVAPVQADLE